MSAKRNHIVVCLFVLIFFARCATDKDSELLMMENAPWGREYFEYFKGLEKRGLLIRDKYDSLVYHGVIDNDSITIVVNGTKWPSKRLMLIELFLGNYWGNNLDGGFEYKKESIFSDEKVWDLNEYISGYRYKDKASAKLINRCVEFYNREYGPPDTTTIKRVLIGNILEVHRFTWARNNGTTIQLNVDTVYNREQHSINPGIVIRN